MRIVELVIRNFRAIRNLAWQPPAGSICLVGPGDTGKTTVLDAIELVLSPRGWVTFVESDFFGGVVTEPIDITLSVTDLPAWTLSQDKYGLELRGWTTDGNIRDEPEDDDEPALTIRLRVDEILEPTWAVVSTRNPDGRGIPARDRERLGATRIGDDVDRQLSWGRGSALTRITDDPEAIGEALSEAHRVAREAVTQADLQRLQAAAAQAGDAGARFGANVELPLSVGVDPRALSVGTGSLGLRLPNGVPARSLGVGRWRKIGLAIQEAIGRALKNHGLSIELVDRGFDFEVTLDTAHDALDELGLTFSVGSYLVEVKATTSGPVRLTPLQAQTAATETSRFVLCVVDLRDTSPERLDGDWAAEDVEPLTTMHSGIGGRIDGTYGLVQEARDSAVGIRNESALRYEVPVEIWTAGSSVSTWVETLATDLKTVTSPD